MVRDGYPVPHFSMMRMAMGAVAHARIAAVPVAALITAGVIGTAPPLILAVRVRIELSRLFDYVLSRGRAEERDA